MAGGDVRMNFRVWGQRMNLEMGLCWNMSVRGGLEGMRWRKPGRERELSASVRPGLQSNRDILGVQFLFA